MSVLGVVFSVAAFLVALYGANALFLALLYLRDRSAKGEGPDAGLEAAGDRRPVVPARPEDWPLVTVQLPLYNEALVVKRLVDAVAQLNYPRERLQIQVLDDSIDETTRLARARVARLRSRGVNIELLHRDDQQGFKAGALAHGLASAHGEYVAIFDADFLPSPDFLQRTVPSLVGDPGLAFVQTRWGYLNPDYSTLTRAQTIALDGHFVVEHLARNRSGLLINFNGTAGVWRKEAIEAAGGWQSDTLTEDVDLSFRAQLAGWRALYLPDVMAPAELPPQVAAFRRQQARWATGAAQCLFKLGGSLLRGRRATSVSGSTAEERSASVSPASATRPMAPPAIPWWARLEGLVHLSVWIAHPMSLLLLLLTPLMLLGRIPLTFNLSLFWLMALGPIFGYALSQRHLYSNWRNRMAIMPVLALLGAGLALSNTIAIVQGLTKRGTPFRRTPKFRIEGRGGRWIGTRYTLPFQWVTVGELLLAAYALTTIGLAVWMGHFFSVLFLLLYLGGYGYLGLQGVRDAWAGRRLQPRARSSAEAGRVSIPGKAK